MARHWVIPLVVLLVMILIAGLDFNAVTILPFILVSVWLGVSIYRTSRGSRVFALVAILVILAVGFSAWVVLRSGLLVSYFGGQFRGQILAHTSGPEWTQKALAHFTLRYQKQDPVARDVETALEQAWNRVAAHFSKIPDDTLVVVFPDETAMESALSTDFPDGGSAIRWTPRVGTAG